LSVTNVEFKLHCGGTIIGDTPMPICGEDGSLFPADEKIRTVRAHKVAIRDEFKL
jgi:hypothetical protein